MHSSRLLSQCATAGIGMVLVAAVLGSRGRWKSSIAPGVRHVSTQVSTEDFPSNRVDVVSPLPSGWTQGWLG